MFRIFSLIGALAVLLTVFCDSAIADPDNSFVRVVTDKDTSSVTVNGNSQIDVIAAVLRGLEGCRLPADDVTVGPWLGLPENHLKETEQQPCLTVCVGSNLGATTAYIGVTPKFPMKVVIAIAAELRTCGIIDIRLVSDETVRSGLLNVTRHPVPDASAVNPTDGNASE